MSTTGEKPGAGSYTCNNCNTVVYLDDNSDRLPPCPKCSETEYTP
ncbi:zinc ribbon-containing protein [Paenibacillus sp. FSL K6-2524]